MKKCLKTLFKTPIILVFIAILFTYGLSALGTTAEISRYAIVTAVGIDSIDDEEEFNYEVSLLIFVPIANQSFSETYKVISAKGRSVSEAMDYAGLHIGREIGLSHVRLLVLNNQLVEEDITKYLDYLARSENLAPSTKIMATDVSAKQFLNEAQKLNSETSIKISDVLVRNSDYIYSVDSSLETFFKGFFGPTKVSFIPLLTLDTKTDDGISVSLSDSTGKSEEESSTPSSSDTQKQHQIVNKGDTYIFKNGKAEALLSGMQMKKINLLKGNYKTGSIEVYGITDEDFQNANLTFEISDKSISYKVVYQNDIPVVIVDTKLTLTLSEVDNEKGMINTNVEFFDISNNVVDAVEKKVRNSMAEALEIMRDNQADLIDFYTLLHNSNKKEFDKFMDRLEDKENYLSHIVFKVGVHVSTK